MLLSEIMNEDRSPGLKYTQKFIKTTLDRVTVELEGTNSAVMSRLTNRYARLDRQAKLMAEKRNELNARMKSEAQELFNAEDEVLTRIVETASFTIMLTKSEKAETKEPTKKVNYEMILSELTKLIPAELEEKLKEITKAYTEIVDAKDTPSALRVKQKDDARLKEGVLNTLWSYIKKVAKSIKAWGPTYDKKLNDLKAKAGM